MNVKNFRNKARNVWALFHGFYLSVIDTIRYDTIRYDTLLMQKAIRAHEHIYKYKYNHIQDSKLHTEQYHLHKIHVMECL